ncbi:hypothetical protein [Nocardia aurea]|uniref:Uncharacterized protein n=1 Tax=Nocardia aurea TaxID=2144174 RepID=A0ABV3FMI2_9NOCA
MTNSEQHPGRPAISARLRAFFRARTRSESRSALWHSAYLFAPDLAGAAGPTAHRLIDWEAR